MLPAQKCGDEKTRQEEKYCDAKAPGNECGQSRVGEEDEHDGYSSKAIQGRYLPLTCSGPH
jgi:hypothetical protein